MPKGNLAIGLIWAYFIAWVLSALLHMSDPDVGGVIGLFRASTLASVSLLAIVLMSPIAASQILWRMGKRKEMLAVWAAASILIGTIIGVWGGSGAVMPRILGGIVLMLVVVLIGCLPMWVGRSKDNETLVAKEDR